jgi:hypothetical protein
MRMFGARKAATRHAEDQEERHGHIARKRAHSRSEPDQEDGVVKAAGVNAVMQQRITVVPGRPLVLIESRGDRAEGVEPYGRRRRRQCRAGANAPLRKPATLTPDTASSSVRRRLCPSAVRACGWLSSRSSVTGRRVRRAASLEKFRTLSSFQAVRIESRLDEGVRPRQIDSGSSELTGR